MKFSVEKVNMDWKSESSAVELLFSMVWPNILLDYFHVYYTSQVECSTNKHNINQNNIQTSKDSAINPPRHATFYFYF